MQNVKPQSKIQNSPKVFIILLNWNGWEDAIRCLDALRQLQIINYQLHVIAVDNGSTDGSPQKIQQYLDINKLLTPRYSLITNGENLGFAGGNNVGIVYALARGADYVCLLNNDTEVAPDLLEKMLAVAETEPMIGMLNPKILLGQRGEKPERIWFLGGRINWTHTRGSHAHYGEEDRGLVGEKFIATDFCTGCCLLVKSDVVKKIGLMPEEYFLYYEDVEWSFKAQKAGYFCAVVPGTAVWHKGAASTREASPSYIRYHVRNGLLCALRTGSFAQMTAAYFMTFPRLIWQGVKWLLFPSRRVWAQATIAGIRDAWLGKTGKVD